MTNKDLVEKAFGAIESCNFEESAKYFADDMVFEGPVPEPITKEAFLNLHRAMLAGIPDWKFNFQNVREEGDSVVGQVQVSGTQTHDLPPLIPGLPSVPATGRSFANPVEGIEIVCQGGLITKIRAESVPDGGVTGVLTQLGVELPKH